jgi:hypothetical protein
MVLLHLIALINSTKASLQSQCLGDSRSRAPKCDAKNSAKGTVTMNKLCNAMFTTVLGKTAGKDSCVDD